MTERFSASVAGRLMACHASGNLDVAIPGWEEPVVDRAAGAKGYGTNVHKLFQDALELTPRNMQHYAKAVSYVADLRATRRFTAYVEQTVTVEWLPSKPKTTADLVLATKDQLDVVDWKTGKIPVSVHDNEQMMYYAVTWAHVAPLAKGATLHIVQPWANNIESTFVSAAKLEQFMLEAQAAEAKVHAKDTTFGPSDHCKFCPANPHSRGDKGRPLCPVMLNILYPPQVDAAGILEDL